MLNNITSATDALVQQMETRAVAHIDMDCFYVQVEQVLRPELRGRPVAVVQYNPHGDLRDVSAEEDRRCDDSDGSLIAVSYEARAAGVKRNMRGKEAKALCPELALVQVPVAYKKSDINVYREAGEAVVEVLRQKATACERASIDEVYVDVTEEAQRWLSSDGVGGGRSVEECTWVADEEEEEDEQAEQEAEEEGVGGVAGRGGKDGDTAAEGCGREEHGEEGKGGGTTAVPDQPPTSHQPISIESTSHQSPSHQSTSRTTAPGGAGAPPRRRSGRFWRRGEGEWSAGERLLAAAAEVVAEMRAQVQLELGYTCSAGISHNKILAKLGSGLHKPNQQTLLPTKAAGRLLERLPIGKLRGFGGAKLGGELTKTFGIETVGQLQAVPLSTLTQHFGHSTRPPGGVWIFRMARGICTEEVRDRELAKSRGAGKDFNRSKVGCLTDTAALRYWLTELIGQVEELLVHDRDQLGRVATVLTVTYYNGTKVKNRSCPLRQPYRVEAMVSDALGLLVRELEGDQGVRVASLYVTAVNFRELPKHNALITSFMGSKASGEGRAGAAGREQGCRAGGGEGGARVEEMECCVGGEEGVGAPGREDAGSEKERNEGDDARGSEGRGLGEAKEREGGVRIEGGEEARAEGGEERGGERVDSVGGEGPHASGGGGSGEGELKGGGQAQMGESEGLRHEGVSAGARQGGGVAAVVGGGGVAAVAADRRVAEGAERCGAGPRGKRKQPSIAELMRQGREDAAAGERGGGGGRGWGGELGKIDEEVFTQLPPDIQAEIRRSTGYHPASASPSPYKAAKRGAGNVRNPGKPTAGSEKQAAARKSSAGTASIRSFFHRGVPAPAKDREAGPVHGAEQDDRH